MTIKVSILSDDDKGIYIKPVEYTFRGEYDIEYCILTLTEIYFGKPIRLEIERLLKNRVEVHNTLEKISKYIDSLKVF